MNTFTSTSTPNTQRRPKNNSPASTVPQKSAAAPQNAKTKTSLAPAPAPAPSVQAGSVRPTNAGVAAGTIPVTQANAVGLVTVGPGGFAIQSTDNNFLLKIGADLQTDFRSFFGTGSSSLTDQILLRRVRPTISGTVYKYIDYFIRPDFGQGSVVLYDAYMQLNITNIKPVTRR